MTTDAPVTPFNIPQKTFYFLSLENGEEEPVNSPSVRSIAEDFYGRKYPAISWDEPGENGTSTEYVLDAETCEEILVEEDGNEAIEEWLAKDPIEAAESKTGPYPLQILADMAVKGHIPFGTYLISLSY